MKLICETNELSAFEMAEHLQKYSDIIKSESKIIKTILERPKGYLIIKMLFPFDLMLNGKNMSLQDYILFIKFRILNLGKFR